MRSAIYYKKSDIDVHAFCVCKAVKGKIIMAAKKKAAKKKVVKKAAKKTAKKKTTKKR